ncbi:glutathione-dependent formaldehyde-activating enzyme domain-containing protein [Ditylenchus destructor]|uniref:Glutathione-dependent formaldehyde-activating enzyme domain-containing protein n=1 Tax=Ditylenchus destructor TaxID=166010 RepID=A0AAD4MUH5_9BILA|nr:glutathione-dependent formaldehyde-activating enzyme domain-containing protein [Ditylenchus destructor]
MSANPSKEVTHKGSCHCGAVQWECLAPTEIVAEVCNCTICTKKHNIHFIVAKEKFTLIKGKDNLTEYTFNTGIAKHTFCKTCGVQGFYTPRSNPKCIGINPGCIDSKTVVRLTFHHFNGQEWEKTFAAEGAPKVVSK